MKSTENARAIQRYIALDIHKEYVMVGAMNAAQEWVIRPRRVEMMRFRGWAENNLCAGDAVVIETTTNVWDIYDIVAPLVTRAVVAHAGAVRQIAEARVKTDTEDIKRLLRLLIADIVPEVWVPPAHVRELRGLISYRNRLVKTATMIRNRLHSLLHRHNLPLPEDGLANQDWWEQQSISALEKLQIRQELALLAEIEKHKAELDNELGKMSVSGSWGASATRLMQLPGIGVVIAMTALGAIGDITRFESAGKLVGYAGLGAGVHDSGKEHRDKKITKSGRKELRCLPWRARPGGADRSCLAGGSVLPPLEDAIRSLEASQTPEPGHCGDRSQDAGDDLVCSEQAGGLSLRQRRRSGLQDADLVMEHRQGSAPGNDAAAVCQVWFAADWRWGAPHSNCA